MATITNKSFTGEVTNVNHGIATYSLQASINLANVNNGDSLTLESHGFQLPVGTVTDASGKPVGTLTLLRYLEDSDSLSRYSDTPPTTYKREYKLTFTNSSPVDSLDIQLRSNSSDNHSTANKDWRLNAYVKLNGETVLSKNVNISKAPESLPTTEVNLAYSNIYFEEGAENERNTAIGARIHLANDLPSGSFIEIDYPTSHVKVTSALKVGNTYRVNPEVHATSLAVTNSHGVYQSTKDSSQVEVVSVVGNKVKYKLTKPMKSAYAYIIRTNDLKVADPENAYNNPNNFYTGTVKYTISSDSNQVLSQGVTDFNHIVIKSNSSADVRYKPKPAKVLVTTYHRNSEGSKEEISGKIEEEKTEGDSYTTIKKEIEGFTYVSSEGVVSGKLGSQPVVVTYYYKKNPERVNLTVRYVNSRGIDIEPQDTVEKLEGDSYSVSPKEIPNYTLDQVEGDPQGYIGKEDVVVIFKYEEVEETPDEEPVVKEPEPLIISRRFDDDDCVLCDCKPLANEVITKTEPKGFTRVLRIPVSPDVVKGKTGSSINLGYILDVSDSRESIRYKSTAAVKKFTQRLIGDGLKFAVAHYSGNPGEEGVYNNNIPYDYTRESGKLIKDFLALNNDAQLAAYKHFETTIRNADPSRETVIAIEGDFADFGEGGAKKFMENLGLLNSIPSNVKYLLISDELSTPETITNLVPNKVWYVKSSLDREKILEEFTTTSTVDKVASATIQLNKSAGVSLTSAKLNGVPQTITGGSLSIPNAKLNQGENLLEVTITGKIANTEHLSYTFISGSKTEQRQIPVEGEISTSTTTNIVSCDELRAMNEAKLRDLAIMFRDLDTCNLAEYGAKGFYNTWCMMETLIDVVCDLMKERAE